MLSELLGTKIHLITFYILLTYIVLLDRKDEGGNILTLVMNPSCGIITSVDYLCTASQEWCRLEGTWQVSSLPGKVSHQSRANFSIRLLRVSSRWISKVPRKQKLKNRTKTILFATMCNLASEENILQCYKRQYLCFMWGNPQSYVTCPTEFACP